VKWRETHSSLGIWNRIEKWNWGNVILMGGDGGRRVKIRGRLYSKVVIM